MNKVKTSLIATILFSLMSCGPSQEKASSDTKAFKGVVKLIRSLRRVPTPPKPKLSSHDLDVNLTGFFARYNRHFKPLRPNFRRSLEPYKALAESIEDYTAKHASQDIMSVFIYNSSETSDYINHLPVALAKFKSISGKYYYKLFKSDKTILELQAEMTDIIDKGKKVIILKDKHGFNKIHVKGPWETSSYWDGSIEYIDDSGRLHDHLLKTPNGRSVRLLRNIPSQGAALPDINYRSPELGYAFIYIELNAEALISLMRSDSDLVDSNFIKILSTGLEIENKSLSKKLVLQTLEERKYDEYLRLFFKTNEQSAEFKKLLQKL